MWFCEEVRPGVWVGFTDATSGNLAFHVGDDPARVAARRAALDAELTALSFPAAAAGSGESVRLRYMNQVHGRDVAVIEGSDAPAAGPAPSGVPVLPGPTADAMVSRSASLAVMVADCVPVVLVGRAGGGEAVLGVAHAGRPGVQAGVIAATVGELRRAGATAVQAWIGPSVCGRCYEVPEAMRAAVAAVAPAAFATTSWGTPALDLPAAVVAQLAALDVPVRDVGVCTLEHREFFSHRRAVRDGEAEGRFIGFAAHAGGRFP
ncbi:laccase domain-containing protein [Specibacter sp. RAF43]|uniref:laccase domain-containing protein n=1 Tax=Specibacter sp. RAF43 TaxID=3233057 RepID=UPI003F9DFF02